MIVKPVAKVDITTAASYLYIERQVPVPKNKIIIWLALHQTLAVDHQPLIVLSEKMLQLMATIAIAAAIREIGGEPDANVRVYPPE